MYFGIQNYGPRPLWQPDPEAYYRKLRAFGLSRVEPCVSVFDDPEVSAKMAELGFWPVEEFFRMHKVLAEIGLETPSVHIFTQDPAGAVPKMTALAEACGVRQFVFGCPQEIDEAAYRAYAEACKAAARELEKVGAQLLFHNNGAEIAGKLGGKTAYEFLLDCCGGLCGMQPDIGWLAFGGEDPEAFLWRNEDRVRSLHYRDWKNGAETPIGKGELDLFACFQFARAHGIPQIMDMDTCTLEDIGAGAKLLAGMAGNRDRTSSVLCTLDVDTGKLTELRRFPGCVEAPNWLADGDTLLYNAEGKMWKYHISADTVEQIGGGVEALLSSNDHVPSPDGRRFGVTTMEMGPDGFAAPIHICSLSGGVEKKLTHEGASWLHGWSPDGKELVYCAFRCKAVDIYTMPAEGGEETCLTDGQGYNDGPEYSPDGKHIWFNSTRSGLMQAWRMDRDGGCLTQMTHTDNNEWFPHVSPDGKRVVYLTFKKGELEPHEHLPNLQVSLSVMDYDGKNSRKLLDFFGGQGSINVNSWAPDSRRVALVVYELEHK